MRSGSHNLYIVCIILVLSIFVSYRISAQPDVELQKYLAKYPGRPFIVESKTLEAYFYINNDQLNYRLNDSKSIMVLTDNAGYLAEQKDYFSPKFAMEKLEAWSEVPVKNKYKKQPVATFSKTVEISDGIYYDDQYCYKYTFPSVTKGVKLISTSSTVTTETRLPITFYFGGFSPVEEAVVKVYVPNNVKIKYRLFGYDTNLISLTVQQKKEVQIYTWRASLPKAYDGEVHAPSIHYYVPHIIIQATGFFNSKGFQPLIENLDQLYAFNYSNIENINTSVNNDIAHLADSLTAGISEPSGKVRAIYRWVQQNIKYVAIEDGDNGLVPRPAELVLQRRYGDCKDKTSILVSMIKSIGLNASYVWIGTRDLPYKYSDFPTARIDNHMIACWWDGNKPVILDGTSHVHQLEDIPAFIQGKECLIEKGKNDYVVYKIPVAPPEANQVTDSTIITISGDILSGQSVAGFWGEKKADAIDRFDGHDTSKYKNIVSRLLPKASNKYMVTKVETSPLSDVNQPFYVNYCFNLPDYVTNADDKLFVNLNLTRYLADINLKPDRWVPYEADMTIVQKNWYVLQIPQNMEAATIPEPVSFENDKFGFKQVYSLIPGAVVLKTEIRINFQVIEGNDLAEFRKMIQLLSKSYLQTITLQKK